MRILITGSTGLGKVVADAFEGNEVKVIGRKTDRQKELLTSWDLRFREPFDVVIHTAGGGMGFKNPLLSSEELYALFRLNIGIQADINRDVLPSMIERKSGYICHVCSIASGEAVGSVGYNTVKAALSAYVRSLGNEMAQHGIVVSGIAPGGFRAPGNAMERLEQSNPEAYGEFERRRLPRGQMGKAEELIPLIKLLTSPEGSMMGGCVVPIDAGEGKAYT